MFRGVCRLFSNSIFSKLSTIQIRDELARRGLRRQGVRSELIGRLTENEDLMGKLKNTSRPIEEESDSFVE